MNSRTEPSERGMPSALIGLTVAAIVVAVVAILIAVSDGPTLPFVSGSPMTETVESIQAEQDISNTPDPQAPDAYIARSGQFVTPEDTDDATTTVEITLPD